MAASAIESASVGGSHVHALTERLGEIPDLLVHELSHQGGLKIQIERHTYNLIYPFTHTE
jgi:hypothetical protein